MQNSITGFPSVQEPSPYESWAVGSSNRSPPLIEWRFFHAVDGLNACNDDREDIVKAVVKFYNNLLSAENEIDKQLSGQQK